MNNMPPPPRDPHAALSHVLTWQRINQIIAAGPCAHMPRLITTPGRVHVPAK